jgi:hypothetical protein
MRLTVAVRDLQPGLAGAPRRAVGDRFNPPHLIPLVEVVAGTATGRRRWADNLEGRQSHHHIVPIIKLGNRAGPVEHRPRRIPWPPYYPHRWLAAGGSLNSVT